jgi:hypothetical protein
MARFRVAFDGRWQEDFDTLPEAEEWAQEVSATGRTTYVIEHRRLSNHFRLAFPEERADEAKRAWKRENGWARVLASFGSGMNGGG